MVLLVDDHSYSAPQITNDDQAEQMLHDHSYSSPVMYIAEPIDSMSSTSEMTPSTPVVLAPVSGTLYICLLITNA